MKQLLFLLLFANISFSQQIIKLCDDSSRYVTYSTDNKTGLPGSYYWSVDNGPYVYNGSTYGITWSTENKGDHTLTVYFESDGLCPSEPVSLNITVEVCELTVMWAPNVFTPNGDAVNNTWTVHGENYSNGYLYIVNRWGETVFESYNLNVGWDGTYGETPCSEGVYIYILSWRDSSNKLHQQTGQISLIR